MKAQSPFDLAVKKYRSGKYWKRRDAIAVLARLEKSGLTLTSFVRKYRLPEKRVHYWKKRLGEVAPQAVEQPEFVALQVIESEELGLPVAPSQSNPIGSEASPLEVIVNNGRIVRVPPGFDPMTLSQVVEVLEVTPC